MLSRSATPCGIGGICRPGAGTALAHPGLRTGSRTGNRKWSHRRTDGDSVFDPEGSLLRIRTSGRLHPMRIQPVILCGGSGTRLWPLSREQHPKQLLALNGDSSMLQATALRLTRDLDWDDCAILPPLVVSNEEYRFISAEQLRTAGVEAQALILEP